MKKHRSQLKIGIILNYLNMILGNLVPIFYTPVMLRLLGQSEYGIYKLASSVISYLSLVTLGIGSSIVRYLIKSRNEGGQESEERMLGLFLTIYRIIAIIAVIIGGIFIATLGYFYGDSLSETELFRMRIIVAIMVCNSALSFTVSPYVSISYAHEQFVFIQLMSISSTLLIPIINVIALYMGFASIGMTVTSLVVNFSIRVAYTIFARRSLHIKPNYKNMPTDTLREILLFSFWVFLASIVDKLYNTTDTLLIGMVPALASKGVAIYNVGTTFNNIAFSVSNGLSSVLTPRVNKLVFKGATNDELLSMAQRIGRMQGILFGLIASGFIAFGKPFIYFYAGADYSDAYWIAVILLIPYSIPLMQTLCLSIVVAKNKHRFRSIVYLIIAIVNVIGTWFAMKKWGIVGAAMVTSIAFIIGQGFVMNWYYHNRMGLNMLRFWKKMAVVLIIPVLMCSVTLVIARFIDFYNIPVMIIGIVLYAAVYMLLNWFIIMNDYEKDLLRTPVQKILSKFFKRNTKPVKKNPLPQHIIEKSECSGCHACFNVCPKGCISMLEDDEGFIYPSANKQNCNDCGLCKKVCPIKNNIDKYEEFKPQAFAAFNKDESIRLSSSSGGIFTLLANSVLDRGGVVVGAAFADDFSVEHIVVNNIEELGKLRKSKYVQSMIGDTYKRTKDYLQSGKTVLFTGTPCQIAGLRAFLGKDYDNLICQDSVCHGVPSQKVFNRYIKSAFGDGKSLASVDFRDKSDSWKNYKIKLDFSDGEQYTCGFGKDPYMQAFVKSLSLRPSCYNCSFKGVDSRLSDITLADFWGHEDFVPEFNDDKGLSLVIINTRKGKELFGSISQYTLSKSVPVKSVFRWNPSAVDSAAYCEQRDDFFNSLESVQFTGIDSD